MRLLVGRTYFISRHDGSLVVGGCAAGVNAKRRGRESRSYVRDLLIRLPARPPDAGLSDLLPDRWQPS